jgi:YHS domain-containing protein
MHPNSFPRRNLIQSILFAAGAMLATLSANAAEAPLAIRGYDPVAYFTDGKPGLGQPEFEYEWDERRYRFSSAGHRELFKADPVRYAPQFANFCAMSLAQGEITEADPENWLISDGKLYIFGKSVGPELFQKNLTENVTRANQNRQLHRRKARARAARIRIPMGRTPLPLCER